MQGWLFLDEEYWNVGRAGALLTSAPRGKILVLDLASTTRQAPHFHILSLLSLSLFRGRRSLLSWTKKLLNFKQCPHLQSQLVKKIGPRLRELEDVDRSSRDAVSRNLRFIFYLGSTFLTFGEVVQIRRRIHASFLLYV